MRIRPATVEDAWSRFDFSAAAATETALTLHVPADAKVYLAGNPTNAQGELRVYRTTGLSAGKAWNGYTDWNLSWQEWQKGSAL